MPAETTLSELRKSRILVVEDDRASRSALTMLLRSTGFDSISAGTVGEALTALAEGPTCLILDLMLPDGNGSTVLAHIRRNNLPIRVALATGAIDWEAMVESSPGRPDAVFQKPLDIRKLTAWLEEHCGGGG
ncbi:MAG: response regulator consisting of a CheY-like receiver domain and a Fis-type domain protein [Phycisphaerales bacterium]|nr:response regulator consisting of a CheY-like receiver domain and a Fis-type domain protein [Phycisphaerales bacterium]MDB5299641.1 response regulator consisting of a CheY-like receiver domain and a Fis-type domain protein [Phycisphaerales bacterium]